MSKVKDIKNLDAAIREEEFKEQSELASSEAPEEEKKTKPILTEAELKVRKAKRTRVAVAAFILLLGIGIMGNWYLENSDYASTVKPSVTSSQTKTLGEAEYVDGAASVSVKAENEYFSSARLDRQSARDEAVEKLQSVLDSDTATAEAKKVASEGISRVSGYISIENKIETLVTAKGADNCIAVISEDGSRVDIIVDVPELTDALIVQIKEIAMQQLGCGFEDVSIIQSKD
ncbi:MAG: SpoIIIAH-like family protein [Eubacterium sp.]|nr:SpoIIIAH-like family protein [Eubacterium sp.]